MDIVFSADQIRFRVEELGWQISNEYGRVESEPIVICVLKGAMLFFADLVRNIHVPIECEFIRISTYENGTESTGKINHLSKITSNIEGRDILIVEDIIDTGHTLKFLYGHLLQFKPKSIKSCVLLDKKSRRETQIMVDFVGFECPDIFVVGYGLDDCEKHRNLPFITCKKGF